MVSNKHEVCILDSIFTHTFSSSLCFKPKNHVWIKQVGKTLTVLTDTHVSCSQQVNSQHKIAWLVESPSVFPAAYEYIKSNHNEFTKIFTCEKSILETARNSEFIPIGGCWIPIESHQLYNKNKNVSLIASNKCYLNGHKLRQEICNYGFNIDIYGRGRKEIDSKLEGLKDYKFSIAVENCKTDYYFTEKIIDCFVTGTIPIYWGCPSIEKFFDKDGIMTFENVDELKHILNNIEGEYEKRYESVKNNFELAKRYLIADDLVYQKIKQYTI